MKNLVAALSIILFSFPGVSQEEEEVPFAKSNEVGIYAAPGMNRLSGLNYFGGGNRNTTVGFGVFYARTFVPHFKARIGLGMSYMFSNNTYENGYTKYRSMHIEVPVQFHYVFNPKNKVQAYIGLGISINRWMNTRVKEEIDDKVSVNSTYNPKKGMVLVPIILAGINLNLNEEWSLYLQPEYKPMLLQKGNNTQLRSVAAQLGFVYHL